MNYVVMWTKSAEMELASLWLDERFRPLLAQAAASFDIRLQEDPKSVGESREEGHRIDFEPPFAIIFRVEEARRRVIVLTIWAYE